MGSPCDHPCVPSLLISLSSDLPKLLGKFIHSQDFSYCLRRDLLIISSSELSPRHVHFHFPTDRPRLNSPQTLWTQHAPTGSKSFLLRNLLLMILSWPMAPPCSQLQNRNLEMIRAFPFTTLPLPPTHLHLIRWKASH